MRGIALVPIDGALPGLLSEVTLTDARFVDGGLALPRLVFRNVGDGPRFHRRRLRFGMALRLCSRQMPPVPSAISSGLPAGAGITVGFSHSQLRDRCKLPLRRSLTA